MALHSDRQGTLWVAGSQQMSRFVDGRFVPVEVPDVVRSARVMALTSDFDGRLWLCTALRGVMTWDGKSITRFDNLSEREPPA